MTAEIRYPAGSAAHRERRHHRSARRQNIAILVTASLVGLWLGVTAPSVSPASPATAPATAATPTQIVNTNPAPPDQGGPRGPGGGRR